MGTRHLLIFTYLLNIVVLGFAYGVLGVFLGIGASIGAYALLASKEITRKWATKAMLYTPHFMGIIAVHSLFNNSMLTLLAGIGEVAAILILGSV